MFFPYNVVGFTWTDRTHKSDKGVEGRLGLGSTVSVQGEVASLKGFQRDCDAGVEIGKN